MTDLALGANRPAVKQQVSCDDWILRGVILLVGALLVVALVLPLYAMLSKSMENKAGEFVGLANYIAYFKTPALAQSVFNSFFVSIVSTVITVVLAFGYAFALTRSAIP
ncbi:MAG: putative 2-aminoethylphosphonate ABC transporter permease subunit, partial [Alphaproteobacteria bacterium]|nr:putative 2-aminoethylphosphonate ABC transporter permease subunit [Alphaproteobacteria bacterium]